MKTDNELNKMDQPLPVWFMIILPVYAGGFLVLLLLPAAGDWFWLEAWLVIISFSLITTVFYALINNRNPRVLRNRMKTRREGLGGNKERTSAQDLGVMIVMSFGFFGFMILAGLDHRYDWSRVPFILELVGLLVYATGYVIMNLSLLENAFASKLLDINQDQQLIDTGPYAYVRHPLYSGALLWLLFMPLALGSWWALIPAVAAVGSLVYRIKIEEEMLLEGMAGYANYQRRVKYKLIPGVY
jgi:protein-S-isoprenylcysteine O-methyltransferase Ste14